MFGNALQFPRASLSAHSFGTTLAAIVGELALSQAQIGRVRNEI